MSPIQAVYEYTPQLSSSMAYFMINSMDIYLPNINIFNILYNSFSFLYSFNFINFIYVTIFVLTSPSYAQLVA